MPLPNLIFVIKDGVFDCSDQIPAGYRMKKYSCTSFDTFAEIEDFLDPRGVTLIIAAHNTMYSGTTATARADQVINKIKEDERKYIKKVIYLVCSAAPSMSDSSDFDQVAPEGTLALDGDTKTMSVISDTTYTLKDILKITATDMSSDETIKMDWKFLPKS